MADPSINPAPQQIRGAYPQSDNGGQAILDVLPADWGNLRLFRLTIPHEMATNVLAAVTIADPSDPNEGLPVDKTMELSEWYILNYNLDVCCWYGDFQVAQGFGFPIREAVDNGGDPSDPSPNPFCNSPGFARLRLDPSKVYLYHEGGRDLELVLALVGRNIEA